MVVVDQGEHLVLQCDRERFWNKYEQKQTSCRWTSWQGKWWILIPITDSRLLHWLQEEFDVSDEEDEDDDDDWDDDDSSATKAHQWAHAGDFPCYRSLRAAAVDGNMAISKQSMAT